MVALQILESQNKSKRLATVKRWLGVAEYLHQQHCYDGTMSIFSALSWALIERLDVVSQLTGQS